MYLQLQKSGKFNCSSCSKYFKTTGGLLRHQRHCSKSETRHEKDTTQQIFQETISDVLADECYPDEIKIELKTFIPHENQITILFEEIKPIYERFCKISNAEQFLISFYSNIVKCSRKYIQLPHPLCVTMATRFWGKLLPILEGNKMRLYLMIQQGNYWMRNGESSYLAGYVVTSMINKIKSKNHHGDSELNKQMLLVLQACKIHDISELKLIACQTWGGLTGVNVECQKIFIIPEQILRAYTSAHHLNIIENEKVTKSPLENIKVISHLNSFLTVIVLAN